MSYGYNKIKLYLYFWKIKKKLSWQDNYSSHTHKTVDYSHVCFMTWRTMMNKQWRQFWFTREGRCIFLFHSSFFMLSSSFSFTTPSSNKFLVLLFFFVYKPNWPVKSLQAIWLIGKWNEMNWVVFCLFFFIFWQFHRRQSWLLIMRFK